MDATFITILTTVASGAFGAGITYYFAKMREQETEWRKLKLEHYKAFMLALSGVVSTRATQESHARYADAVNTLQLVAPAEVLRALNNFQSVIAHTNKSKTVHQHDEALTKLLQAMRADVHPSLAQKHPLSFRLLDVPREQ